MSKQHSSTYFFYTILILFITILFNSCEKGVNIENSPAIVDTKNQTVKKLQFTLSDSALVIVKLKNLLSSKELSIDNLPFQKDHEVLLAGLKPDQNYSIQILDEQKVIAEIDSFHTSPIKENVVNIYERTNTPNAFNGYLLTQRRLLRGSVYMMDNESDLVWYQMIPRQPKLSYWTKNNEVLVLHGNPKHNNSAGDKIIAYTIDGEISYQLDLSKLGLIAHHEVIEYEDDLVLLVYDTKPNKVNGKEEEAISSAIVRISKSGEILWKWSTFDVKDPNGIPTKDMDKNWGHANAFSFDDDGNILISYRDWNQIWKIDVKTGKRIWVLGDNGSFEFEETPFNGQHAIHKNPNGHYMLFDNGKKDRQSRIVSYELKDSIAKSILTINLPEDLYADRMGNVQILSNGNILVCSPRSRSIVVVNPKGDIVFHINTGIPDPYRVTYIPSFYSEQ